MDVGLIDSLLREAEAEAEAEAELWTLQTRHIAAHASGPPALRKRAREGPGGLLHLTRQTGPVPFWHRVVVSQTLKMQHRSLMGLISLI